MATPCSRSPIARGGGGGELSAIIREAKPGIILVPFFLDDHADHMRAAEILALADLPKCEIWCYQVYGMVPGNLLVDITDVARRKADLIRCWNPGSRDWAHYALGQNAFQCRALRRGGKAYAESFFVIPAKEYAALMATMNQHIVLAVPTAE